MVVRGSIRPLMGKVHAIYRLQLLLIVKLPILIAIVLYVTTLGFRSVICFLVGYLLVYFALLLGAIYTRSAPATCDEGQD